MKNVVLEWFSTNYHKIILVFEFSFGDLFSAGVGQDVTAQYAIAVQAATGGGIQLVTAGEVIKDTHGKN